MMHWTSSSVGWAVAVTARKSLIAAVIWTAGLVSQVHHDDDNDGGGDEGDDDGDDEF